jgi:hypothetical protein
VKNKTSRKTRQAEKQDKQKNKTSRKTRQAEKQDKQMLASSSHMNGAGQLGRELQNLGQRIRGGVAIPLLC